MRKKAISMASIMLILVDFDHAMMAVGELCLVLFLFSFSFSVLVDRLIKFDGADWRWIEILIAVLLYYLNTPGICRYCRYVN